MTVGKAVGVPFRPPTISEDIVYHYTSMSGLKSIIESKKLWLSEASYLNDSSERVHFLDLLGRSASALIDEKAEHGVEQQLIAWLRERRQTSPMVFVGSFSKFGNLLSQWRGYCPNGIGISIGFKRSDLEAAASDFGFSLQQCNYEISNQTTEARSLLTKIFTLAKEEVNPQKSHPSQSYFRSFFELEDEIIRLSLQYKSPAFREEGEWRLISPTFPNYVEPPIKYRATSSLLVPYLEFNLPTDVDGRLLLEHIYVGPNPNGNRAIESVGKFLSKSGVRHAHVSNSQIPYRV